MNMKCYLGIFTFTILVLVLRAEELGVVKIFPEAKERFVSPGDALSVQCAVTTKTQTSRISTRLQWKNPSENGVTVTKRTEIEDGLDRFTANLAISSIKPEHLGHYECTYGDTSASFTLRAPIEEKTTANFTYEDKTAVLSCNVSGPAASKHVERVVWLKNDTYVTDLDDHERFTETPENRTLIISKPMRKDADLYIARFTFKDMDKPYDCAVPYTATPMVMKFEKSKNLIEDDTMELQCKVLGYPHAAVIWMKNDKVLNITNSESHRVKLSPLNGYKNARLVIKSVKFEDAGDYTCKAYSDYFNVSDSKTLAVRVKDKLAALWPFLGIVGEVIVLCAIIFIYEKRRNKQAESDANNAQDVDGSTTDKKEGLRHRNTQSNNPTA